MLREEGSELHLLSAISPAWIGAGKSLHVARASTYFGGYGFDLKMPTARRAILTLHPQFGAGSAPEKVVLHVPWFMQLVAVRVDGKVQPVSKPGFIELGAEARTVEVTWNRRPSRAESPCSYDEAVSSYKREYARRFTQALHAPSAAQPSPLPSPR
jgi:hypothetical protein